MLNIRIIPHLVNANGLRWFLLYLGERIFSKSSYFKRKRFEHEVVNRLPGFNTSRYNYKEWKDYDWSNGGEEWTDSKAWKDALIKDVLLPFVTPEQTIVEIGPGGGRWSTVLAASASKLILVDITEKALAVCKAKLVNHKHIEYQLTSGNDLSFVQNDSVDLVWAFDVFVHLAPSDTENYLVGIARILKPSGVAIIHHPAEGGIHGGFRSSVTNDFFNATLSDLNLKTIRQFSSWDPNGAFSTDQYRDSITIFSRDTFVSSRKPEVK